MERISSVEFDKNVSPRTAIEAVQARGACAIHSFTTIENLQRAAAFVRTQPMILDESSTARVPRRQHMNAYAFDGESTPNALTDLAVAVKSFVNKGELAWTPNEIIAHRYQDNDFIGRHRDYSEAYGLVAVLTLDGMQDFYVELDDEPEPTKVTMQPGTLTMLRGFTCDLEKRPYHWVDRPASQRLALSIRDMREVWTTRDGSW